MNLKTSLKLDAIKRYQERNHLRQGSIKVKNDTTLQVASTLSEGTHQISDNTGEKLTFGLTLEERSSIEADINAKKPIGDTPAYRKFLQVVIPNKIPSFPYFSDHKNALIIVSKLSDLFGKPVRLPTKDEAIQSMRDNNHLTGSCNTVGRRIGVGEYGNAWIIGDILRSIDAPSVCHYTDSSVFHKNRRLGLSVIPVFG